MSTNPLAAQETKAPLFTSATYDKLKAFNQLVLPALATLYAALALIWGFPYGKQVVGSITALCVFLGVLLQWASKRYDQSEEKYDGVVVVTPDPFEPNPVVLNTAVDESKKQVILKVDTSRL